MIETKLGKITKITFGLGGYQDACIGINVTIEGDGWGTCNNTTAWDSNLIKHSDRCKWTESDRDDQYANIVRYASDLLRDAKVTSVDQLRGKPVEATFEGMQLKSWRILTEVL